MQPEAGQQLASPDFWVIVFRFQKLESSTFYFLGACSPGGSHAPMNTTKSSKQLFADMIMPRIATDLSDPTVPVARYLRARSTHDVAIGRRAFHPETVSRAIGAQGTVTTIDQDEMWTIADASTAVPVRQSQRTLDQLGSLAVVETRGEWITHAMLELLQVVRQRSGWLIVGRVFVRSCADAEPPVSSEDDQDRIRELIGSCAGSAPPPSHTTHVADCRYTFFGEPDSGWSVSDRGWHPDYLGGHEARHLQPTVAVEVRGAIAVARLLRTLHPHRIVNHVLLVRDRGGWKIAHVTCSFTPRALFNRNRRSSSSATRPSW
ncbi:MAG TPA: nuclear transport factor 2 family protein [Kofleriaceae bacterium]|nr:nuclear transport factor 2 family protein [Kofleriaceae bacterium]